MIPRTVVWWSHGGATNPIPNPELVQSIELRSPYVNKPSGGFWTSPLGSEYGWEHWCRDNELEWLGDPWHLTVAGTPRVLVIDSAADLDAAFERWPHVSEWGDERRWTDRGLDWTKIAEEYDAVWLTERGHFDSRLRGIDAPSTYSWDCETVLWFRWCFDRVERVDAARVADQPDVASVA